MAKQNISITVDSVIFQQTEQGLKVLLVKRGNEPFKGQWALPGGFLEDEEPLEDGAKRELEEETGLKMNKLEQFRTFGTPGRDPRGRIISIVHLGVINSSEKVKGADDAAEAEWKNVENLPDLAFDHSEILRQAIEYFKKQPA